MRAVLHTQYGPPDLLRLGEVEKPIPGDDEVLIKIHATTVTSSDCNIRNFTFTPKVFRFPMRLQFGFNKPKVNVLGIDLAGEIESLGKDVTGFTVGQHVFGTPDPALGAHAEYISIPEGGVITTIPSNTTWEEAAAIPLAGNTALYFIRDLGQIQAGQKVLINGASGAIGTYAVQLAKHFGAEVTGVCSTANLEMVRALGADHVVDYTQEDFTHVNEAVDVIFDAVGKLTYTRAHKALKDHGIFLAILPTVPIMLRSMWSSVEGNKKVKFGDAVPNRENLVFLKELTEAGKLKAVIDRSYPLEQTAEAFAYVEQGHKKGNVVITVGHR